MYIARTGELVETKDALEIKFYILDEDDAYKNVKGHKLSFPLGTPRSDIDNQIAKIVKNSLEKNNVQSHYSIKEIETAAIQSIDKAVVKVSEKINGTG